MRGQIIHPVATNSATSDWRTIAAIIIGVLAFSAIFVWMAWRLFRSVERMERDPKYLRRRLIWGGALYVFAALFAIVQVAIGEQPKQILIGLPIPAFIAWQLLRTANRVNASKSQLPPSK
jgi:hypothetical protein